MNDFGNLLSALRKEKGWTQSELADKLGITNQAISKWENGDSFPETGLLAPLSELFGISIDELLKGRRRETPENEPTEIVCDNRENGGPRIPENVKPDAWQKKFAITLSICVSALIAGVVALILFCLLAKDNQIFVLCGLWILLSVAAVSVGVMCYTGILDSFYFRNVNRAEHKDKVKTFARAIACGVSLCIVGVAFFCACAAGTYAALVAGLTGGFALIAAGVFLFIYFGIIWEGYIRSLAEENIALNIDSVKREGVSRFSGVVMLAATVVFLALGFFADLWHPGWAVFPLGGVICAILGAIDEARGKKDD